MKNIIRRCSRNKYLSFVTMLLLIATPIFGALRRIPIRLWDESRLAINAIEMARSNHWLVPTFGGAPDMWNTKPPLLIWMQALLIKLIGIDPLAIRLPVAIAAAVTCIYLFFVLGKVVKDNMFALIAIAILITTGAYLTPHVVRTGDYDGLLILFTTLFCFSYFRYLSSLGNKYLYFCFLFLSLAILTKSVEGLIFLPGLFIFTLLEGKLKQVFLNKHLYAGIGMLVIVCGAYYLLREIYNPGYLRAVYENELGGRFLDTIESHNHPFYYYFEFRQYLYWLPFFLTGIVLGLKMGSCPMKRIVIFSMIMGLSFFLIISCSQTKLSWYDAPAFPFFAVVAALPVYKGYQHLRNRFKSNINWKRYVPLGALCLLFLFPYFYILKTGVFFPKESSWEIQYYRLSGYLKGMISGKNNIKLTSVIIDDYQPQVSFYIAMANEKGFHLIQKPSNEIEPGETILLDNEAVFEKINKQFYTEKKFERNEVSVLYIAGRKTQ